MSGCSRPRAPTDHQSWRSVLQTSARSASPTTFTMRASVVRLRRRAPEDEPSKYPALRLLAECRSLASPGIRCECAAQIAAGGVCALVVVQAFVVGGVMTGPALDLPAAEVPRRTAETSCSAVGVSPACSFDTAVRTTDPRPAAASLVGVDSTAAAQGAGRAVTVVQALGDDATAGALASELVHVETYGVVRALAVGRACAVQIAAFSIARFECCVGAW